MVLGNTISMMSKFLAFKDWFVWRTVVSPAHQGSSPKLDIGARIISEFISDFQRCSFSGRRRFRRLRGACADFVKSQDVMPAQYLGSAHRGKVYMYAFIRVSVYSCI